MGHLKIFVCFSNFHLFLISIIISHYSKFYIFWKFKTFFLMLFFSQSQPQYPSLLRDRLTVTAKFKHLWPWPFQNWFSDSQHKITFIILLLIMIRFPLGKILIPGFTNTMKRPKYLQFSSMWSFHMVIHWLYNVK